MGQVEAGESKIRLTMKATANEKFQRLVQTLYESHLHFYLQETPFSAQIHIRKKFLKNDRAIPSSTVCSNETAQNQIMELQKKIENFSQIINILECKLEKAESKALKAYDEKKTEIDILKNSIKKSDHELRNLRKDLDDAHKIVDNKEKNFKKLEEKCENLAADNQNVKTELRKMKNENKRLLKATSGEQLARVCCVPVVSVRAVDCWQ